MLRKRRSGHVRIPRDVDSVSRVDEVNEARALNSGLSRREIDAIWKATQGLYRSGAYPGVGVCLRHRGEVILDRTIGHARGNGPHEPASTTKVLLTPETPMCIFSASKAATAALMLKLIEDGGAGLHDPVSRFIPAFARHGKGSTTIAHVLSHRGGFPSFHVPSDELRPELLLDWDYCIDVISRSKPAHRRRKVAYHALTGGFVLAEIIQRVTGQSIRTYLDETLRKPLGMTHFTYGLPKEHRHAVAHNYMAGRKIDRVSNLFLQSFLAVPMEEVVEISNSDVFLDAVIPAGNMHCTADELSRFFQMLLNNGRWQDRQVLRPETVRLLRKPASGVRIDRTLGLPMRYSMGMMLGANPVGMFGPMTGRVYGHVGMMNVFGWADPQRELAAALIVTGKALLGSHLLAVARWQTELARRCK